MMNTSTTAIDQSENRLRRLRISPGVAEKSLDAAKSDSGFLEYDDDRGVDAAEVSFYEHASSSSLSPAVDVSSTTTAAAAADSAVSSPAAARRKNTNGDNDDERFRTNPVAALEFASRGRNQDRHQREVTRATVDPATARKCAIADYYFLDHYYDTLRYLHQRKLRLAAFNERATEQQWSEQKREAEWRVHCAQETAYLRTRRTRTNALQFQILAQIGQGGYGQVFLARKKGSGSAGEVCALKKMNKKLLLKMNEIQHILTERDVLTQTSTEWLVKLLYAFQDTHSVYLAMEYVPGGDMRTLLNNSGILRETDARFYASEMFMAVTELHRIGYLHRDLKPENFLIDTRGHVKLTDFGLSKGQISAARLESLRGRLEAIKDLRVQQYSSLDRRSFHRSHYSQRASDDGDQVPRAFSLVGSPDYMAPEILTDAHHNAKVNVLARGYDYLVDYWSLGCILFEMLCGYPPFAAPTLDEVWVNVYHWQEVLERPQYDGDDAEFNLSDAAWDLVNRLLTHRHRRLPNLQAVQAHPWFNPLNRALLSALPPADRVRFSGGTAGGATEPIWSLHRTLPPGTQGAPQPPFIPALTGDVDHSNFDDFTDPRGMEIYKEVYDKQARLNALGGGSGDEADGAAGAGNSGVPRSQFVGFTYRHKEAVQWRGVAAEVQRRVSVLEAGRAGNIRDYLRRRFGEEPAELAAPRTT